MFKNPSVVLALLLVVGSLLATSAPAEADSSLTFVKDALSTAAPGATSVTHTINFTTTTAIAAAANKFTIDFSSGPFAGVACGNVSVSGFAQTGCSVAANVLTLNFTAAISAATAITVTVSGTTNPNPGVSTSYRLLITSFAAGTSSDHASAVVNINSVVDVQINIQESLLVTLVNSPVSTTLIYDLDPLTTPSDATKTSTVTVKSNARNGFNVTVLATKQATHTGYGATALTNSWGGTTTVSAAWTTGTGFGYSKDGGATYYSFDTVTPQPLMTAVGPTSTAGQTNVLNYKAATDWTQPAGIYTTTLLYVAVPNY